MEDISFSALAVASRSGAAVLDGEKGMQVVDVVVVTWVGL